MILDRRTRRLLTGNEHPQVVLTAACHLGVNRQGQLFEQTCDDYRRRIGVLYRGTTGLDLVFGAGSKTLTSGCIVYSRSPCGVVTRIGLEQLF